MANNLTTQAADAARALSSWFPTLPGDRIDSSQWRLDVVTLLAVIGESAMTEHSQTITASALCLLPRILPAPQALLKPQRPMRMPQTPAKLTGVRSGVTLDTVGFFANIIIPLEGLQPFEFRVVEINHKDGDGVAGDIVARKSPAQGGVAGSSPLGFVRRLFGRGRRRKNKGGDEDGPASPARLPRPPSLDLEETLNGGDEGKAGEDAGEQPGVRTGVASRSTGRTVTWVTPSPSDADPEQGGHAGIRRRPKAKDKVTDFVSNPTLATSRERPAIPAALYSPLHILSVFSMLITAGLLGMAIYWTDGPATIAVVMISVQSSVVGYASWWRPILMKRTHTNVVPAGDVMIRTREGAFVLVRCTEEVARELFTAGTEECHYRVGERVYRFLMGLGTMMLMVSAVLLGNCSWNMQLFVAAAYISLNALYWALGMLPRSLFWDLSRYEWRDVTPDDAKGAHAALDQDDPRYEPREGVPSFTRTLWYAIRETRVTGWAERSGAAPSIPAWQQWLREAEEAVQKGDRAWPAVGRKDEIMKQGAHGPPGAGGCGAVPTKPHHLVNDPGKLHAPLTEVQAPNSGPLYQATDSF